MRTDCHGKGDLSQKREPGQLQVFVEAAYVKPFAFVEHLAHIEHTRGQDSSGEAPKISPCGSQGLSSLKGTPFWKVCPGPVCSLEVVCAG